MAVDIEQPESIAALERIAEHELAALDVPSLSTGVLRSERRSVTTMLAEKVKASVLDDESMQMGIHFGSKHGGAWCKAFWLDHPNASAILPLSPEQTLQTDHDLVTVADRFRIRVF